MPPILTPSDLLRPAPAGLYCPIGDFHIDPVQPVARALITHGHADHARSGHGAVLASRETLEIMAIRYGEDFCGTRQIADMGGELDVNGVKVTFAPAGHVLGSAQIRVEHGGMRITASGDYKRLPDPTCAPFEPLSCDVFITEATFGLPVFNHPAPRREIEKLLASRSAWRRQDAHAVFAEQGDDFAHVRRSRRHFCEFAEEGLEGFSGRHNPCRHAGLFADIGKSMRRAAGEIHHRAGTCGKELAIEKDLIVAVNDKDNFVLQAVNMRRNAGAGRRHQVEDIIGPAGLLAGDFFRRGMAKLIHDAAVLRRYDKSWIFRI